MKTLIRMCACATAFLAFAVWADEDEPADASADEVAAVKKPAPAEKFYRTLPLCRLLEGAAEVLHPGQTEWKPLEEGRFYPLGCTYRTLADDSKLIIEFGKECQVTVKGIASFGTRLQGLEDQTRSISLMSGGFTLSLPRNMPDGNFSVAAPGFTVTSAAGESTYAYEKTGDGDSAVVRCVTGALQIKGRHFVIPTMHAANEVKIRTSQDLLFTGLYGTSGDYELRLDQGMVQVRDVETGATHVEPKTLVWKLSPRTAVRIHRARPKIGERMSVTTMTFEPSGKLVNRCTFCEGLHELNTGEQGEIALKRIEEQSKKAAEQAELSSSSSSDEAPKDEEKSDSSDANE